MLRKAVLFSLTTATVMLMGCEADEQAVEGVPLDAPAAVEEAPLVDTVELTDPSPEAPADDTLQGMNAVPDTTRM